MSMASALYAASIAANIRDGKNPEFTVATFRELMPAFTAEVERQSGQNLFGISVRYELDFFHINACFDDSTIAYTAFQFWLFPLRIYISDSSIYKFCC